MAENSLQRCLKLCRRAGELQDDALHRVLSDLEAALKSLSQISLGSADEITRLQNRILEHLREPVVTLDQTGFVTGWSRGAQTLFGYTAAEAVGQHVLFLSADESTDGDNSTSEVIPSPEQLAKQGTCRLEVRRRKKSGEVFRASLSLSLMHDGEQPIGLLAQLSEITEHIFAEDKRRLHARIIEDSDQGILIANAEERIVSVNPAFTRITGYSAAEAIGQTPDLLRSGVHNADFRAQINSAMHGAGPWQGEIIGKRKNGELFPQSVSISVARDEEGRITHAFSIFSDISVLRATEERMQRLVNYDNLTGLPNRTLLNQLVAHALTAARRNKDHGALLVIDLNRFTSINDTLGHEVGDELLRQVGQRFRKALRDEDVLARIGGDEFVAALLDIHKREHSGIVAQNLLAVLQTPFLIESHSLHVGASIGIAVYPDDALDTASLLRFADVAMKRVQENGEAGYLFYCPEMNQLAKDRWRLESELRHAVIGGELLLYYQPKVSLRNGRIVGSEALIRWQHPERGMVPPGNFIPLAEETGVILELGSWVLAEACRQIRAWTDAGVDIPPVAVNLSARQFDAQLPARVLAVLEQYDVPPDRLKLEITESLLVRGQEKVIPIMNELVAMGLGLSLDDFGTGYSSLAYLKKFPITTLKIDRSFVIGVPSEKNDCAIAQAIVTMGQQLRQEIVAEGVETYAQMSFLRGLGCDQLQGFLFSPPVSATEFERMIREKRRLCLDPKPGDV